MPFRTPVLKLYAILQCPNSTSGKEALNDDQKGVKETGFDLQV
jgi:hypothetical protein